MVIFPNHQYSENLSLFKIGQLYQKHTNKTLPILFKLPKLFLFYIIISHKSRPLGGFCGKVKSAYGIMNKETKRKKEEMDYTIEVQKKLMFKGGKPWRSGGDCPRQWWNTDWLCLGQDGRLSGVDIMRVRESGSWAVAHAEIMAIEVRPISVKMAGACWIRRFCSRLSPLSCSGVPSVWLAFPQVIYGH